MSDLKGRLSALDSIIIGGRHWVSRDEVFDLLVGEEPQSRNFFEIAHNHESRSPDGDGPQGQGAQDDGGKPNRLKMPEAGSEPADSHYIQLAVGEEPAADQWRPIATAPQEELQRLRENNSAFAIENARLREELNELDRTARELLDNARQQITNRSTK